MVKKISSLELVGKFDDVEGIVDTDELVVHFEASDTGFTESFGAMWEDPGEDQVEDVRLRLRD
jgi:hypothetical protein